MATITLQRGRVQPVWAGHPWVYAQAIERIDGAPTGGDVVDVVDPEGRYLGRGYYTPGSAIPVRIASRDKTDALDGASIGRKLERAHALRSRLGFPSPDTSGFRLVHAEGDGLPGLIVDVFGELAVVQLLTLGMKLRENDVFAHVARVSGAKTIIEAASEKAAEREGFESTTRVVRGPDPGAIRFLERGLEFEIESAMTQKTGFYFDQRENRARVESMSHGARVLDAYAFMGAFGLSAARGGAASVLSVDSSAPAVAMGARNAHRHGFAGKMSFERADVKSLLRDLQAKHERFDLVVLDPPKLAPTVKHLDRARVAYRRLNAEGVKVVASEGILVTCSCSAAMTADDFVRTVTLAARDANADVSLLAMGSQGPDHPVPGAFPEGRYLKCAFFRVSR